MRGVRAALTRTGAPSNLIQNGLIQRRLADKLQLKEFSPAPTLAPEIQAVIMVDDLSRVDREETQRIVSIGTAGAAVAAQFQTWQLFNPANSGVLVRLRWTLTGNPDVGGLVQHWLVGVTAVSIGGSQACPIWNTRTPTKFGQAVFGGSTQPGAPPGASQILDYYQPYLTAVYKLDLDGLILPPGFGLNVSNAAANQASSITVAWIEEDLGR